MKKTILVVEDYEPIRRDYVEAFSDFGFNVISATDGVEGLRLAISHHPDLIITDRNMPNLDGYRMSMQLKSNSETKKIPILGRGGFGEEEQEVLDYFFPKEGKVVDFYKKVAEILGKHIDIE